MDYKKRWIILGDCGGGGQGKVFRVYDDTKFNVWKKVIPKLKDTLMAFNTGMRSDHQKAKDFQDFRDIIKIINELDNPDNHGALKILHEPENARDFKLAEERIKREIHAMQSIAHPNLLKVLDADPDSKWYVSKFYPKQSLSKNPDLFVGDFVGALKAIRPLVEGVAMLHEKGFVHRDIKPDNVFIDDEGNLVLGDFGLIFFENADHTRLSDTWENVGSRDWMPGWAMGMKIEDIRPTFDVFALGKLLWAMISDTPKLRLWYYDRSEFDLAQKFPEAPFIKLAKLLFRKSIVEQEKDCLSDANAFLQEIDKLIITIENQDNPKQIHRELYTFQSQTKSLIEKLEGEIDVLKETLSEAKLENLEINDGQRNAKGILEEFEKEVKSLFENEEDLKNWYFNRMRAECVPLKALLNVRTKQELRTLNYFDEEDKLTEDGFVVIRRFYGFGQIE